MANKDVLSARSDYFATMFSNKVFIEGETNQVSFNHCSKAIMEKIIHYLFSGSLKLHNLSLPDLVTMMNMTTMMLLDDLKEDIHQYLLEIIPKSGNNYGSLPELVESLMLSEQVKLNTIQRALVLELHKSLEYIPYIPDVVKNADAFKRLPYNLLQEILLLGCEGVEEDDDDHDVDLDTRITSPEERFDAFVFWLSENECTAGEKQRISESFNLYCFTAEELITDVRKSGLYSIEKIDRILLEKMESLRDGLKRKNKTIVEKNQEIDGLNQVIQKMKRKSHC